MSLKLLVIGHGRHGKDTFAEIANEVFETSYISSSEFCAEEVMYPLMKDQYVNAFECWKDRANHRDFWYEKIKAYNSPNLDHLTKEILSEYDTYVGMRDDEEFEVSKCHFDLVIWVDASERVKIIDTSMKIKKENADIIIENNTTLEDFREKVIKLLTLLYKK